MHNSTKAIIGIKIIHFSEKNFVLRESNSKAGAIAGVHSIKNPVKGARAVMEKSHHALLTGGLKNLLWKKVRK